MGGGGHDSHEPVIPAGSLQDHFLAGIALAAMIGIGWWTSELTQPITVIPAHGCHGDSHPAAGKDAHGTAAESHAPAVHVEATGGETSQAASSPAGHEHSANDGHGHGNLSTGQEQPASPDHH